MTRSMKQTRRRLRKAFSNTMRGAAMAATPLLGSANVVQAEWIEYTAQIEVDSIYNLNNTVVGDTILFRAIVETDNLVLGADDFFEVPLEFFEAVVDGSATEIWQGANGTLSYRSVGDQELRIEIEPPYSEFGEYQPHDIRLDFNRPNNDTTFTSFHPSGLPTSFHVDSLGAYWQWRFSGGQLSKAYLTGAVQSLSGPPPQPCVVGDADCDGFVDVSGDIFSAFSNFTGPGSYGKTRAQGDVQGAVSGATPDLDPHDGDVDVSDILTMFGNFTGPPSDEGSLTPANAGDPTIPDLVYDPATGEVVLDVDGSGIIGYSLKSGGSFLSGGHTPILGGVTTSLATELAEAALSSPAGQNSVGFVFPTGLNLAGLNALLTTNEVSRGLGAPIVPFDLVVLGPAVPEPSTAALAATAGLAGLLALRKRRRREDG